MLERVIRHDDRKLPLVFGLAERVDAEAYGRWGLQPHQSERPALNAYLAEWANGNADQLRVVSLATMEAGLGDYPRLLRQKTAEVAAGLLSQDEGSETIEILDVGAGPGESAAAMYFTLPKHIQKRVVITLLDPSSESLIAAQNLMESRDINYKLVHAADLDALNHLKRGAFRIATATASIHHHAELPVNIYSELLEPGGHFVSTDWHHGLWLDPNRVLGFLKRFEGPDKEKWLDHWQEVYPPSQNTLLEPTHPFDIQAEEQIIEFWLAYKEIADRVRLGNNSIWVLEGHRPVSRYIQSMKNAGFDLNSPSIGELIRLGIMDKNPHQLLPNSSLLQVLVGQKAA